MAHTFVICLSRDVPSSRAGRGAYLVDQDHS